MAKPKNLPPVVVAFGRFNPPTRGHEKLFAMVIKTAKEVGGIPIVYLSGTQDRKKNPLSWTQKFNYIKQLMPKFSWIISKDKPNNPFEMLAWLQEAGYTEFYFVAGEDRVDTFSTSLHQYAKKELGIKHFEVVLAAKRSEKKAITANSVEGISASKLRQAAVVGDFKTFALGVSDQSGNQKDSLARSMMNDVRKGLGIKSKLQEGLTYLDIGHRGSDNVLWRYSPRTKNIQLKPAKNWETSMYSHLDAWDDWNDVGMISGRIDKNKKIISYSSVDHAGQKYIKGVVRSMERKFPGYKHAFFGPTLDYLNESPDLSYLEIGHKGAGNILWMFDAKKKQFRTQKALVFSYSRTGVNPGHSHDETWEDYDEPGNLFGRIDTNNKTISYYGCGFGSRVHAKGVTRSLERKYPGFKHVFYGEIGDLNEYQVQKMHRGETYLGYGHDNYASSFTWLSKGYDVMIRPATENGHNDMNLRDADFAGRIDTEQKVITVALLDDYMNDREQTYKLKKVVFPQLSKKYPGFRFKLNRDITYAPGLSEQLQRGEQIQKYLVESNSQIT